MAWQEVVACCCVVINRELLFFLLGLITQGSRPDRDKSRSDRLMVEEDLRDAGMKTWTIMDPKKWLECDVLQSYGLLLQSCFFDIKIKKKIT